MNQLPFVEIGPPVTTGIDLGVVLKGITTMTANTKEAINSAVSAGGRIMTNISASSESGVQILVSVYAPEAPAQRVYYVRMRNDVLVESSPTPEFIKSISPT